jgi:uncharacterized protein
VLLVGYLLAALVGIALGILGGGGSILTVPIFVYVLGYDPKLAIAMSLPVVGVTSLVGAVRHWRAGNVHLPTAAGFGLIAMVGAFVGAKGAAWLTGGQQLLLLAAVMLVSAVTMFRSARRAPDVAQEQAASGDVSWLKLVPVALVVGTLTGLVGIGGGFLVVPALVLLARAPMTQAVGTSLLVIAMNAASGFAGYVTHVAIPWTFVAGFTAIAVAGLLVGMRVATFASPRALKQGFAVFLLAMGVFVFYRNRAVLLAPEACATPPCDAPR